jgi:hypothetical protein
MLGMLKRHEVEILLKAGHSKAEVTRRLSRRNSQNYSLIVGVILILQFPTSFICWRKLTAWILTGFMTRSCVSTQE